MTSKEGREYDSGDKAQNGRMARRVGPVFRDRIARGIRSTLQSHVINPAGSFGSRPPYYHENVPHIDGIFFFPYNVIRRVKELNYVVYAVSSEILSSLGQSSRDKLNLVEVWSELPHCDFVQAKSGNGKDALRAEGDDLYIWVSPSTVEVLDQKPLLRAVGKRSGGRMNFLWVEAWPAHLSRAQCVARAIAFNDEQIARAIRSRRTG